MCSVVLEQPLLTLFSLSGQTPCPTGAKVTSDMYDAVISLSGGTGILSVSCIYVRLHSEAWKKIRVLLCCDRKDTFLSS